jgi:hypothetical protein
LDFPEVAVELEEVLLASTVPIEEIIGSGGGETKGTQRLRKALRAKGWEKHIFIVRRTIDDVPREAQSHEVDHVRRFEAGTVALEIEWNNKDPFFDRDLENFKRLHADGAISLGIIVTRGPDLQDDLKALVTRFADEHRIDSLERLAEVDVEPTTKQRNAIMKRVNRTRNPVAFRQAWIENFVSNKFGAATTHWNKLEDRVLRGVGNPCPLMMIGLPTGIVTFDDDPRDVEQLLKQAAAEEQEEDATSS